MSITSILIILNHKFCCVDWNIKRIFRIIFRVREKLECPFQAQLCALVSSATGCAATLQTTLGAAAHGLQAFRDAVAPEHLPFRHTYVNLSKQI